jgi:HK97 gp10 family phage protein
MHGVRGSACSRKENDMPDGFTMTLDSAALMAKLKSLEKEKADKIMGRAFHEGAKVYQAAVSKAAPERPELPSGTALPPGALKTDVVISHPKSEGGPIYEVEFGAETAHVASWVENGHRLVRGGYSHALYGKDGEPTGQYRGPGKQVSQVEAHPFFRKAFEAATPEAEEVITNSITRGVEKATK